MILTAFQSHSIRMLLSAFRRGNRAALLQLPTGQGKSLVSIHVFRNLLRDTPRLRLILVTPSQRELSNGWRTALKLSENEAAKAGECLPVFGSRSENFCRVSLRQLSAFLKRGARPSEVWQRWLVERRAFVVIDEFHHNKELRRRLAGALHGSEESDDALPKWMRVKPGRPAAGPLWLLVSATPFNPVQLDFQLDAPDDDRSDPDDVATTEEHERRTLVREVHDTLACVARLGDVRGAHAQIAAYCRALLDELKDIDAGGSSRILSRPPVPVIPTDMAGLGPRYTPRLRARMPVPSPDETAFAIRLVREIHQRLPETKVPATLCERLLLAGVRHGQHRLEGIEYGQSTMRGVARARLSPRLVPPKLASLEKLASSLIAKNEKLLVFCTHRAVAARVARHLRSMSSLSRDDVLDASSLWDNEVTPNTMSFARRFCEKDGPRIFVATDAFSESVDLHTHCGHMAHFELPWSPLRVLQRYGRLWRIRGDQVSVPVATHFIHPGGVEEEILNRLRRRWGYLHALGLGYLRLEQAIGARFPSVPWRASQKER